MILGKNTQTDVLQNLVVAPIVAPDIQSQDQLEWPPVFGLYEPDPEPVLEPEPEVEIVNHSFLLKGLFASDTNSWAIVEDGGGEYLLRVGDELPGGAIVHSITSEGVHLNTVQGSELIAFDE